MREPCNQGWSHFVTCTVNYPCVLAHESACVYLHAHVWSSRCLCTSGLTPACCLWQQDPLQCPGCASRRIVRLQFFSDPRRVCGSLRAQVPERCKLVQWLSLRKKENCMRKCRQISYESFSGWVLPVRVPRMYHAQSDSETKQGNYQTYLYLLGTWSMEDL